MSLWCPVCDEIYEADRPHGHALGMLAVRKDQTFAEAVVAMAVAEHGSPEVMLDAVRKSMEEGRIARLRDVVRDLEGEIAQGHAIDIASNLSATAYEKLRQALADASIRY